MKNKIILSIAFATLLPASSANAEEKTLPNDPWAGMANPTVDTAKHSPYGDKQVISQAQTTISNAVANAEQYFSDIPNKPAKYNKDDEISAEYITFIVDRLRDMGYEIDPKVDRFIAEAPSKLRGMMLNALADLRKSPSNSVEGKIGLVLDDLEKLTGFNMENIIDNTTRLIDPK